MRVYLSGAMTGQPLNGFPAFDRAHDFLLDLGHDPVSPADIDRANGVYETTTEFPPRFRFDALRGDVEAILTCDAIALLPGWEASRGARDERTVAEAIGLPCYRVDPDAGRFYRETLIGIAGVARSGKDTVARFICDFGYERKGFADPLKAILYALNPTIRVHEGHARLAECVDTFGWEGAKSHDEVRRLLQRLGTEGGRRNLGEDIWVETLLRSPSSGRIVISDCRFLNEVEAIRSRGGVVVKVERPGVGPLNSHPSETALSDVEFDLVVRNDGSVADLKRWADEIVTLAEREDLGCARTAPDSGARAPLRVG